jgi:isochorismate hydrolase
LTDHDSKQHELEEATRNIARLHQMIIEQETRVAILKRDGRQTPEATRLLDNFRGLLDQVVARRDRLASIVSAIKGE